MHVAAATTELICTAALAELIQKGSKHSSEKSRPRRKDIRP